VGIFVGQSLVVKPSEIVDQSEDEDEGMVRCQGTGLLEHRAGLGYSFGAVVSNGERYCRHYRKGVERRDPFRKCVVPDRSHTRDARSDDLEQLPLIESYILPL